MPNRLHYLGFQTVGILLVIGYWVLGFNQKLT
jgi:hypothetical protein